MTTMFTRSGGGEGDLSRFPKSDVEIINSLQVQGAEKLFCIFHDASLETYVGHLVRKYASLRVPLRDYLQVLPGRNPDEETASSEE